MGIGKMTLSVSLKKAVELGFSSKMARHVCWDAQCLVFIMDRLPLDKEE